MPGGTCRASELSQAQGCGAVFSPEGEGVLEFFAFFEFLELGGGAELAPGGDEG